MDLVDRAPDWSFVRIGKVLITTARNSEGAPLIDGCVTRAVTDDDPPETHHYGGVLIRRPGSNEGITIGWRDARTPNPGRWLRWPFVKARIRWYLAGRPAPQPMTNSNDGGGYAPERELTPDQRARFEAAADRALARRRDDIKNRAR